MNANTDFSFNKPHFNIQRNSLTQLFHQRTENQLNNFDNLYSYDESKIIYPKEVINRREYQIKTVTKSQNLNSLIIMPTRLGKTTVLMIIAFNAKNTERVVYVSNDTESVRFLSSFFAVEPLDRTNAQENQALWQKQRIIFISTEVLYNSIINKQFDSLESEYLLFDDFNTDNLCEKEKIIISNIAKQKGKKIRLIGTTSIMPNDKDKIQQIITNMRTEQIIFLDANKSNDDEFNDISRYIPKSVNFLANDVDTEYLVECFDKITQKFIDFLFDKGYIHSNRPNDFTNEEVFSELRNCQGAGKKLSIDVQNTFNILLQLTSIRDKLINFGPGQACEAIKLLKKKKMTDQRKKLLNSPQYINFVKLLQSSRDKLHPKFASVAKIITETIKKGEEDPNQTPTNNESKNNDISPNESQSIDSNINDIDNDHNLKRPLSDVKIVIFANLEDTCKCLSSFLKEKNLNDGNNFPVKTTYLTTKSKKDKLNLFKTGKINVLVSTFDNMILVEKIDVNLYIFYDQPNSLGYNLRSKFQHSDPASSLAGKNVIALQPETNFLNNNDTNPYTLTDETREMLSDPNKFFKFWTSAADDLEKVSDSQNKSTENNNSDTTSPHETENHNNNDIDDDGISNQSYADENPILKYTQKLNELDVDEKSSVSSPERPQSFIQGSELIFSQKEIRSQANLKKPILLQINKLSMNDDQFDFAKSQSVYFHNPCKIEKDANHASTAEYSNGWSLNNSADMTSEKCQSQELNARQEQNSDSLLLNQTQDNSKQSHSQASIKQCSHPTCQTQSQSTTKQSLHTLSQSNSQSTIKQSPHTLSQSNSQSTTKQIPRAYSQSQNQISSRQSQRNRETEDQISNQCRIDEKSQIQQQTRIQQQLSQNHEQAYSILNSHTQSQSPFEKQQAEQSQIDEKAQSQQCKLIHKKRLTKKKRKIKPKRTMEQINQGGNQGDEQNKFGVQKQIISQSMNDDQCQISLRNQNGENMQDQSENDIKNLYEEENQDNFQNSNEEKQVLADMQNLNEDQNQNEEQAKNDMQKLDEEQSQIEEQTQNDMPRLDGEQGQIDLQNQDDEQVKNDMQNLNEYQNQNEEQVQNDMPKLDEEQNQIEFPNQDDGQVQTGMQNLNEDQNQTDLQSQSEEQIHIDNQNRANECIPAVTYSSGSQNGIADCNQRHQDQVEDCKQAQQCIRHLQNVTFKSQSSSQPHLNPRPPANELAGTSKSNLFMFSSQNSDYIYYSPRHTKHSSRNHKPKHHRQSQQKQHGSSLITSTLREDAPIFIAADEEEEESRLSKGAKEAATHFLDDSTFTEEDEENYLLNPDGSKARVSDDDGKVCFDDGKEDSESLPDEFNYSPKKKVLDISGLLDDRNEQKHEDKKSSFLSTSDSDVDEIFLAIASQESKNRQPSIGKDFSESSNNNNNNDDDDGSRAAKRNSAEVGDISNNNTNDYDDDDESCLINEARTAKSNSVQTNRSCNDPVASTPQPPSKARSFLSDDSFSQLPLTFDSDDFERQDLHDEGASSKGTVDESEDKKSFLSDSSDDFYFTQTQGANLHQTQQADSNRIQSDAADKGGSKAICINAEKAELNAKTTKFLQDSDDDDYIDINYGSQIQEQKRADSIASNENEENRGGSSNSSNGRAQNQQTVKSFLTSSEDDEDESFDC